MMQRPLIRNTRVAALSIAGLIISGLQFATAQQNTPPDSFERIWSAPSVYSNADNRVVQDFAFIGRYHGQYWYASSESNHESDWENRRMFVGFKAGIFDSLTLETQIAIAEDFDPFYDGLYVAFLEWENETSSVSGGRLDYLFTGMERSTSSKQIATIERSLVVNQTMPGEVVGIHGTRQLQHISFHGGIFSGSIEDEFTSFDGKPAAVAGISTSAPLFLEEGKLQVDYLYNDGDEANNAFEQYRHTLSLWHKGRSGPLEMGIDFTFAAGVDDQSDVYGLTLLPVRDLATDVLVGGDLLQLAARYHYAASDDPAGLSFNRRYEQEVASGMGDRYHSLYLGLNYLLYSHKLKLIAGAQYFRMSNVIDEPEPVRSTVDGWDFALGLRLYF